MLTSLFRTGAFLTALFSITTLFNSLHPWLELFCHFRLQYFACAVLLLLVFAALRDGRWAGGMLALVVVNALPLTDWYLPGDNPADADRPTVLIMQANVLGHDNPPEAVIAEIRTEQPDVVFLQEVNAQWVDALRQIEADYPHKVTVPRDDNFGIAVYARQPLKDIEVIDSPPAGLPTLRVRQDIGNRPVTFVSTHPLPPMGREMTSSRNTHLQSIAELLASIHGPRVLVGDLNITMWAHHYRELENTTGLRNTRLGRGVIPTWPARLPFAAIPIDHCLVSDEWTVRSIRAGEDNGSDHLPLFVRLAL